MVTTLAVEKHHLGSRRFLGIPEYRRLLATRLASQWGDGLFQAGLAGAVLFNPERQADPAAIEAASLEDREIARCFDPALLSKRRSDLYAALRREAEKQRSSG